MSVLFVGTISRNGFHGVRARRGQFFSDVQSLTFRFGALGANDHQFLFVDFIRTHHLPWFVASLTTTTLTI